MAKNVVLFDGGNLDSLEGGADKDVVTWDAATSSWIAAINEGAPVTFAKELYVAKNGDAVTGDGALSNPFLTIGAALAAAGPSDGTYIRINIAPGTYTEDLVISRKLTVISGGASVAGVHQVVIAGTVQVSVNAATAATVDVVCFSGIRITPGSAVAFPALYVTGTGSIGVFVADSYITTANSAANAIWVDANNANPARLTVRESVVTKQGTASADVVKLDRGFGRFDAVEVYASISGTGSGISIANNATFIGDRVLVDTNTASPGIKIQTAQSTIPLRLTNSAVVTRHTGTTAAPAISLLNTTSPYLGAFLWQTLLTTFEPIADCIAATLPVGAYYGALSFGPNESTGTINSKINANVSLQALREALGDTYLPKEAASLPVKLDVNKKLTGAAIALGSAEVTGTLGETKGGTGESTYNKGDILYSSAANALDRLPISTTGKVLAVASSGVPEWATNNPAVGGDLSGTVASATVVALQGNPVSTTAPNPGETLVWDAATNTWKPATISGGGGGGGGTVYYFNYSVAGDTTGGATIPSGAKQVSRTFSEAVQQTVPVVLSTSVTSLATFVTNVADPSLSYVPPGNWEVAVFATSSAAANQSAFRFKVQVWNGTALTLLATSEYVFISDPGVTTQYTATAYVPATDIDPTDRLVVSLEGIATVGTPTLTTYFEGATVSHTHTTVGVPGGTGVLKVVDGYLQSPASAIVDSDIATDADIAPSKLAAGTNGDYLSTVAGVPTWAPLPPTGVSTVTATAPLASSGGATPDISLTGIVAAANGGTGTDTVPAKGTLLKGNTGGTAYTTLAIGLLNQVLTVNGSGDAVWSDPTSEPTGPAGGDLSSTYPDPTVAKINGASVPAAGALTTGNVLQVSGASALSYGPLNLATAGSVTGTLPVNRGGTGQATVPTGGQVVYGASSGLFAYVAAGTTGQVLASSGTGAPTWTTSVGNVSSVFTLTGTEIRISGRDVGVVSNFTPLASTTIPVTSPVVLLEPTGAVSLTAEPQIVTAGVTAGTRVTITNIGTGSITFTDASEIGFENSGIQLGGVSTRTLLQYQSIDFVFTGTYWVERSVGGSGSVQSVTASSPLAATAGDNPVISLDTEVPVNLGGTGLNSGTTGGVLFFSGATVIGSSGALDAHKLVLGGGATGPSTPVAVGTLGAPLISGGTGVDPSFTALTLSNADAVTGVLAAENGGTGIDSYTVGQILFASGATTLSPTAAPTSTGQTLTWDSVTSTWLPTTIASAVSSVLVTAPIVDTGSASIPNIGLGTVPVNKGGTNITSYTTGQMLYASGTTTLSPTAVPSGTGQVMAWNGTAWAPAYTVGTSGSEFTVAGREVLTPTAIGNITSASTLPSSTSVVRITSTDTGAAVILGSTPTINVTGVSAGAILTVLNTSGYSVTLRDESSLAGSKIRLAGVSTRTVANNNACNFVYNGTAWVEIAAPGVSAVTNVTGTSPILITGSSAEPNIELDTVPATKGGTGYPSYAVGDLLYADTTTSLAKLADVAAGNVLISGGVAAAPNYGKVILSGAGNHVTGKLLAPNGGTGFDTYAVGDLLYADTTTTLAKLSSGTVGQILRAGGAGVAPTWSTSIGASGSDVTTAGRDVVTTVATTPVAGTTIPVNVSVLRLSGQGAAVDLTTTTPTFAVTSIANGTRITVINESANSVTFGDETTYADTKVQLGGVSTRTLLQHMAISFIYDATTGFWVETGVGGSGTVLSVTATSPLQVTGAAATPNVAFLNASANTVLAGPTTGAAAAPGFRALLDADMPSTISGSKISGNITGNAANVTGTVAATNGGTGQATWTTGDLLYASATNTLAKRYIGTTGQVLSVVSGVPTWAGQAYDIASAVYGLPGAGATIMRFVATRAFTISATAADHRFSAGAAASGSATFTVYKNNTSTTVFTATFALGGTTASPTSVTNNTVAAGDVIFIVAPGTPDATLADIAFTITGTLI